MDLIALAVVVVVVLVVVVRTAQVAGRPERGAGHADEPADTTSDRFYRGADRPAGPDAEDPLPPQP